MGATSRWKAPPGWARIRRQVFARYGTVCWRCGRPGATTVGHLVAAALGGPAELWNLRPEHGKCNSADGARLKNRLYPGTPRRRGQQPARRW